MPVFTPAPRIPATPVHVDTAQPTPTADADAATRPTSPAIPFESESILLKAKRAYERDRQRAKKRKERADHVRDRDRTAEPQPQHSGAGKRAKPRLALGLAAGTEKEKENVGVGVGVERVFPLSPQVEEIIADVVERAAQARGDVPLDELVAVRPGKARKSKAGEFELVPSMPVVIALDDAMPGATELDEPWEHISADELDEKRVAPPSYATVLATAL